MAENLLYEVALTEGEFDSRVADNLPWLLDHATIQTKRFLRETDQWRNDVAHDKLAQRWGYELLERFMSQGRRQVPCRPLYLLNSLVAKHWSRADLSTCLEDNDTPIFRFLTALLSTAALSRDAMMAMFYHFYGLGQRQVTSLLGLGDVESQRVYKNYKRWRSKGWSGMVEQVGLKEPDLRYLEKQNGRNREPFYRELSRLLPKLQCHYRKSEPAHYPCLPVGQWKDLYRDDCGHDYRGWHLSFCNDCLKAVWRIHGSSPEEEHAPQFNLHVYPPGKTESIA